MATRDDPHFNVFYAYRGAVNGEQAPRRQLEDNLTRAVGIVLRGLGPAAWPILTVLGVPPAQRKKPFRVEFQSAEPGPGWPPPSARRLIAVLAPGLPGDPDEQTYPARDGAARADMVLTWDDFVLVLEAELRSRADAPQMARLSATFQAQPQQGCTWSDLAKALQNVRPNEQPAQFLRDQLEEYLRMHGFGGFIEEHFAYFGWSPERRAADPLTKQGARAALRELLRELQAAWHERWDVKIGRLGPHDRSLWGRLAPPGPPAPHLSLAVTTAGMTLFANVETRAPFERFCRAWGAEPEGLRKLLADLGADAGEGQHWRISVLRRLPKKAPATVKPLPRHYDHVPLVSIGAGAALLEPGLLDAAFAAAEKRFRAGEAAPEVVVERSYDVWQAVAPDFAAAVIGDARRLRPLFDWLARSGT